MTTIPAEYIVHIHVATTVVQILSSSPLIVTTTELVRKVQGSTVDIARI